MGTGLNGGMDPAEDFFLTGPPEDPQFRESVSMWVSDDRGRIGLPRVGIEAVGEHWDQRGHQLNLAFPDGRTAVVLNMGQGRSPVDGDGVCRTFAVDALEFRILEPFGRLTLTYEGEALDTTAVALAAGDYSGPQVPLRVEIDATCALPPWRSGTMNPEARALFDDGFAGAFVSPRYEQLCTVRGTVELGEERWAFDGTALRIHRQGPRDVGGFWGHCWPSALFPSGRGFGALTFPERPGEPTYNEGYLYLDGEMVPATLVGIPWLHSMRPSGEDVSLTFRTAEGEVHIAGETVLASCLAGGTSADFAPALHQAGVRYTWDGEKTFGMMERSIPVEQLTD